MTKKKLKLLLVDFDGVMSNGRFYNTDKPSQQDLADTVAAHIFTENNKELLNEWMRGERSCGDIHSS